MLNDVRRLAISKQFSVRFPLANGMECVIDRHGLARVPGIDGPSDFSIEREFAAAQHFTIVEGDRSRPVTRAALEEMSRKGAATAHAPDDHDE